MADHLDWREFITAAPDTKESVVAALDRYFSQFARPSDWIRDGNGKICSTNGNPCLNCGEKLEPDLAGAFLGRGGFEWGLAHGWGYCRSCGWPAALYHFVKDAEGQDLMTLRYFLLQVHPDFVERQNKKQGAAS